VHDQLIEYISCLNEVLPWDKDPAEREIYLTRTSVVLSSLAVIGYDMYHWDPPLTIEDKVKRIGRLGAINWKRTNLKLVGVVGSEKGGEVQPGSSRQSVDATIRYLREKLDLRPE
jgi:superfamily II DNA/RNA helicase